MASPLPHSSLLSRSQICSAPSSLRRTQLPPAVAADFGCESRRWELNSASSISTRRRGNQSQFRCSALDDSAAFDPVSAVLNPGPDVADLKLKLLRAVSGLNRGLAANENDLKTAESAAKELETAVGPVDLAKDLDKLQGLWKLIYSSAFSSRSLGGSRPGPPIGRLLPITLGQVFQRIDILSKDFDNIVEVQLGAPWPLPQINATATLAHKFELIGTASIKITFEKTTIKTTGNLSQLPLLEVPRLPDALRPSSNTGSGDFEVTYVDSDFRVTRGDKGELRVFVSS